MLGKSHGGLNQTLKWVESARLTGEGDKIKLIDIGFERGQGVEFKKEENARLTGEGDKMKLIDLGFERGQAAEFKKGREGKKDVP